MEPIIVVAVISAVVGALSAVPATIIAIRKFPAERKQVEASTAATWTNAQGVVIANLREENKGLRIRLDTYEVAIEALQKNDREKDQRIREYEEAIETLQKRDREMQKRIQELEQRERWAMRQNTILRKALEDAGIEIPEFKPQE